MVSDLIRLGYYDLVFFYPVSPIFNHIRRIITLFRTFSIIFLNYGVFCICTRSRAIMCSWSSASSRVLLKKKVLRAAKTSNGGFCAGCKMAKLRFTVENATVIRKTMMEIWALKNLRQMLSDWFSTCIWLAIAFCPFSTNCKYTV